jgi:ketosteroid isomerase-like protein
MGRDTVATIRRLFEERERGHVDNVIALLSDDVRVYILGEDRWLTGHAEVRDYLLSMNEADRSEVHAQRLEPYGSRVLVVGRLREFHHGELRDRPVSWVFTLRDGLVTQIDAYTSEPEARSTLL